MQENKNNEFDTYQFNSILHILDLKSKLFKKQNNKIEYERWKRRYEWLKSKENLIINMNENNQNWKPSVKQMLALYNLAYNTNTTDKKDSKNILKLYQELNKKFYNNNFNAVKELEKTKLTEFEKGVLTLIQKVTHNGNNIPTEDIKGFSKSLLKLAKKEICKDEKSITLKEILRYFKEDLPRWKKANEDKNLDFQVAVVDFDGSIILTKTIHKDEYYCELDSLRKLPTEDECA